MQQYIPGKKTIIMTREQVRSFDLWAINTLKIPGVVLMENAGRSCAEFIKKKLENISQPKVCIFCGTGNNGGDGYVIARHLLNSDFSVTVVICGDRDKINGDAKTNLDILENLDQKIDSINLDDKNIPEKIKTLSSDSHMLVDAIFGTGLKGQLHHEYIKLIETINQQNLPIFAVDIPSGLDCDTGLPLGGAIKANQTVTFVAIKTGFVNEKQAEEFTGQIYIASIGIEPSSWMN